jgi:hypothetical protein
MISCPLNTEVQKLPESSIYGQHNVAIMPGCAGSIYLHLLTLTAYCVTKIKPETGVK